MPQYLVQNTYYLSKFAAGLLYQWGRKDPFTFATKASGTNSRENGINSLKIYNAQGKEIVQDIRGGNDTNGAITIVTELASSMLETVRKPNTFHATGWNAVINQIELTKEIYNYYWVSYSRGTDGSYEPINPNWNNEYLDGYNQKRSKNVFDPCPYGFRIPTNGTFNLLLNPIQVQFGNYTGGALFAINFKPVWFATIGRRNSGSGLLSYVGILCNFFSSTFAGSNTNYGYELYSELSTINWISSRSWANTVRCIEDAI